MKNKRIQLGGLVLLIVASVCSYLYLNLNSVAYSGYGEDVAKEEKILDNLEEAQNTITLPNVQILKKVTQLGKRILPGG